MAKSLVFGNGRLHVGLDEHGLVHDLYYPFVGLYNQLPPHSLPHKIGLFENGNVSWLDDGNWSFSVKYHEKAMVGSTIATNDKLGVRVEFTDVVDIETDAFIRNIHIINLTDRKRNLTVYCHQIFMIGDSASSESAQYRPDLPGIMHFKGDTVFIATMYKEGEFFDDYCVGKYDLDASQSTYHDAEDGLLSKNMVENGRVDSVMGMNLTIEPYESTRLDYILIADETIHGCEATLEELLVDEPLHYLARTASYWQAWRGKARFPEKAVPPEYLQAMERSLFIIKAHTDERGAVMASLDSSLRNHPQDDAYNFCWPRDAAYSLWPLLRLGYTDELLRFFEFAKNGLHDDGYLSHKYRADGSLGSTWLPYQQPDGSIHQPIQADETAITLFLVGQYYRHTVDRTILSKYYESLVEPMANFLEGYTFDDGLPRPSYDIWEHSYLTHTYTTAVTYASLLEAAEIAEAYGRDADAKRWRAAAQAIQTASQCFYNASANYFYKGFYVNDKGERIFDDTVDISSLYGMFMYGLFELDSEEIKASVVTAKQQLSGDGLYSRFVGDDYFGDEGQPNLWLFPSLWMAEIFLENDDVSGADAIIKTVLSLANSSGMLPEQVERVSHTSTSLNPLVWSHAELISTLIDYVQAKKTGT